MTDDYNPDNETTRRVRKDRPAGLGVGTEHLAALIEEVLDKQEITNRRLGDIDQKLARGSEKIKNGEKERGALEARVTKVEEVTRFVPMMTKMLIAGACLIPGALWALMTGGSK